MKIEIRIRLFFGFISIFAFLSGNHLNSQSEIMSPRIANYKMDVALDTEQKKLNCQTKLTWRNTSSGPVNNLFFHLYYNAFKNSESTFFKERGVPEFLTNDIDKDCGWAWSDINSIKDQEDNDLTGAMHYRQADDGNKDDQTVLELILKKPVLPGESQTFTFDWTAKIPKTMPRTGYNKDFYFFAQWFPKLGVYELAGQRFAKEDQWNCHQYHSSGEYYSDFGSYEVKITVPENFVVASTGELIFRENVGDKSTWTFKADDVIDFTWTTSPDFVLQEDNHNNTKIKFYTYPYKTNLADRYLPTIKYCMSYLEEHLGPYPYPTLSIIDPPIHGMFTGGMEYPTLITSLSFSFMPNGIKIPETLVVHEFIHQYFMQMVATNETEEPWMDEGITTYFEGRILDTYMGAQNSTIDFLGFKSGNKEYNRAEFFGSANPKIASNAIKSWQYKHGGYGDIAYNKAAIWLQTLEGLIGTETIDDIFRTYFQRWKFKHPGRQDFIDIVNEIVIENNGDQFPEGMDWYFKQVLFGTNECDYAVASIKEIKGHKVWGFFDDSENCVIKSDNPDYLQTEILLYRLGEVYLPQEIVIAFENGERKLYHWDGKDRAHTIKIESNVKVLSVEIDPEQKIMIDKNFINNSKSVNTQSKSINKISAFFISGLQHIVESIHLLI